MPAAGRKPAAANLSGRPCGSGAVARRRTGAAAPLPCPPPPGSDAETSTLPMTDPPRRGRLLVAAPDLRDPNFRHAVVLLLEADGDGALGVVLNRPSTVRVGDALPSAERYTADPPRVFVGGPVEPGAVVGLGRLVAGLPVEGVEPVLDGVGVIDLAGLDDLRGSIAAVRVFAGYAGWGPGQLEAELDAGGWFLLGATPDDAFCGEPDALWLAVLRRQGGVWTTATSEPQLN